MYPRPQWGIYHLNASNLTFHPKLLDHHLNSFFKPLVHLELTKVLFISLGVKRYWNSAFLRDSNRTFFTLLAVIALMLLHQITLKHISTNDNKLELTCWHFRIFYAEWVCSASKYISSEASWLSAVKMDINQDCAKLLWSASGMCIVV